MNMDSLVKYIKSEEWSTIDVRSEKAELLSLAQEGQKDFMPLKRDTYRDNAIQILDFFCGAGGTSLGFAAINSVLPVFNFLGGCDINKYSAETYAHNFDTPIINIMVPIIR